MKELLKLYYRAWKYRYIANRMEIEWLLRSIKKASTAFDIGAHKGGYTYWMQRAVGNKGRVVAFEPQQKGADLLKKILSSNVSVEHLAVSDREGSFDLYIQPQSFEISFEASLENKYEDALVEKVVTTTLDQYCESKNLRPSFLKIDVEGHEYKVLSGARLLLGQYKPDILIEIEKRHTGDEGVIQVFDLLESFGYRGFFFQKGEKRSLNEFDANEHQDPDKVNTGAYINNFVFEV